MLILKTMLSLMMPEVCGCANAGFMRKPRSFEKTTGCVQARKHCSEDLSSSRRWGGLASGGKLLYIMPYIRSRQYTILCRCPDFIRNSDAKNRRWPQISRKWLFSQLSSASYVNILTCERQLTTWKLRISKENIFPKSICNSIFSGSGLLAGLSKLRGIFFRL